MDFYSVNGPRNVSLAGTGRTSRSIGGSGVTSGRVGNLTLSQLLDPYVGTGLTFQQNAKMQQLQNLQGAMSQANPEDYAAMDQLRDYYRKTLADLPTATDQNISSFDTQSQRGLANLLRQHNNAMAGTGAVGRSQSAAGDITERLAGEYMRGLQGVRERAVGEAGQLQSGLGGLYNQDLAERNFQLNQAGAMNNVLGGQMSNDLAYQQMVKPQEEAFGGQWLAPVLGAGATIGGAMIGAGATKNLASVLASQAKPAGASLMDVGSAPGYAPPSGGMDPRFTYDEYGSPIGSRAY